MSMYKTGAQPAYQDRRVFRVQERVVIPLSRGSRASIAPEFPFDFAPVEIPHNYRDPLHTNRQHESIVARLWAALESTL